MTGYLNLPGLRHPFGGHVAEGPTRTAYEGSIRGFGWSPSDPVECTSRAPTEVVIPRPARRLKAIVVTQAAPAASTTAGTVSSPWLPTRSADKSNEANSRPAPGIHVPDSLRVFPAIFLGVALAMLTGLWFDTSPTFAVAVGAAAGMAAMTRLVLL